MIALMVAGIGLILVGLGAIGYGIPVKEFSFGNTLILSGAIIASTGVILIGLAAAVRELKDALLSGRRPAEAAPPFPAPKRTPAPPPQEEDTAERASAGEDFLFTRDRPAPRAPAEPVVIGEEPPPWQQDAARDRARQRAAAPSIDTLPEPPPPPEPEQAPVPAEAEPAPAEPPRQRRNLLFASSRRERTVRFGEPPSADPGPGLSAADSVPVTEPRRSAFDEAWPETDRLRGESPRRTRSLEPGGADNSVQPAAPAEDARPPAAETAAEVTVLKRGVVDGMAYSLYSDGSIEAQMPEGMMRFASIDDLRSYLDQRS